MTLGDWTIDQLLAAEAAGERLRFLPFWGHQAEPGAALGPHVLSQFYPHPFEHGGVLYPTAEHFMMAEKARLFGDIKRRELILKAGSPLEAKRHGRLVRGFSAEVWEQHGLAIVRAGSIAKFSSTPALRSYLVATEDAVLVEASPSDRVWGIGMTRDDPAIERPSQWRGKNLLGFALMQARAALSDVS